VQGWATERVEEPLDRGLVAMPDRGGRVYLGWRLLRDDPEDVGFHVYRWVGDEPRERLTDEPITPTCDFVDTSPVARHGELLRCAVPSPPAGRVRRRTRRRRRPPRRGRALHLHPAAGRATPSRRSASATSTATGATTSSSSSRTRTWTRTSWYWYAQRGDVHRRGLPRRRHLPVAPRPRLGDRARRVVLALCWCMTSWRRAGGGHPQDRPDEDPRDADGRCRPARSGCRSPSTA
jgi:hypothetical protein